MSDGNYYAVMNLRTIRESIYAYATFADNMPYNEIEAAQEAIDNLIKAIETMTEDEIYERIYKAWLATGDERY